MPDLQTLINQSRAFDQILEVAGVEHYIQFADGTPTTTLLTRPTRLKRLSFDGTISEFDTPDDQDFITQFDFNCFARWNADMHVDAEVNLPGFGLNLPANLFPDEGLHITQLREYGRRQFLNIDITGGFLDVEKSRHPQLVMALYPSTDKPTLDEISAVDLESHIHAESRLDIVGPEDTIGLDHLEQEILVEMDHINQAGWLVIWLEEPWFPIEAYTDVTQTYEYDPLRVANTQQYGEIITKRLVLFNRPGNVSIFPRKNQENKVASVTIRRNPSISSNVMIAGNVDIFPAGIYHSQREYLDVSAVTGQAVENTFNPFVSKTLITLDPTIRDLTDIIRVNYFGRRPSRGNQFAWVPTGWRVTDFYFSNNLGSGVQTVGDRIPGPYESKALTVYTRTGTFYYARNERPNVTYGYLRIAPVP